MPNDENDLPVPKKSGFPPKKGVPQIRKKRDQSGANSDAFLQGTAMMARKLMLGETMKELAKVFNMTPATVSSRLRLARTQDLTQLARDIITERLVPKAIAVVDMHLSEGDYKAAKDVLFGTGSLQNSSKAEVHHSSTPTLDIIREERKLKAIDAQIVQKDLPPKEEDK